MGSGHKLKRERIHREKPYIQFRKNYCERCGNKGGVKWKWAGDYKFKNRDQSEQLTAHHIDGNPENNSPENIQTLCRSCHDKIHNE